MNVTIWLNKMVQGDRKIEKLKKIVITLFNDKVLPSVVRLTWCDQQMVAN